MAKAVAGLGKAGLAGEGPVEEVAGGLGEEAEVVRGAWVGAWAGRGADSATGGRRLCSC